LPIYGRGDNVRDWLFVEDHVRALRLVLEKGKAGECYNIGGHNEKTNLEVVKAICAYMDEHFPDSPHTPHKKLITFVEDRPGHDQRYAIDAGKIQRELGWTPQESFESGLKKTIDWYIAHAEAWKKITSVDYQGERLGLIK